MTYHPLSKLDLGQKSLLQLHSTYVPCGTVGLTDQPGGKGERENLKKSQGWKNSMDSNSIVMVSELTLKIFECCLRSGW